MAIFLKKNRENGIFGTPNALQHPRERIFLWRARGAIPAAEIADNSSSPPCRRPREIRGSVFRALSTPRKIPFRDASASPSTRCWRHRMPIADAAIASLASPFPHARFATPSLAMSMPACISSPARHRSRPHARRRRRTGSHTTHRDARAVRRRNGRICPFLSIARRHSQAPSAADVKIIPARETPPPETGNSGNTRANHRPKMKTPGQRPGAKAKCRRNGVRCAGARRGGGAPAPPSGRCGRHGC